jgi:cellulose synthase (UDP-forming)
MSARPWDVRLKRVTWQPVPSRVRVRTRVRLLILLGVPAVIWYFSWLLNPNHAGTWILYGILIVAEVFNLLQALGFWWTTAYEKVRERKPASEWTAVDVYIPVYKEPPEIVDLTVAAAKGIRGAEVRVWVLDDGDDDDMRDLAARHGVGYIRRDEHSGAKAGNINNALTQTNAPFIAVFDSDHVPDPAFLDATLGHMDDPSIAFVQTPQWYANIEGNRIASASMAQQALFFGAICRGKDGLGAVFCCGTCVLFRRTAFESVGGFPTNSLTEDFELSIHLHEKGWHSAYVSEVLASGLGPEDTASYVSQQLRWARGCLSGLPRAFRAKLPLPLKLQYMLSGLYFLSGWTVLIYMSFPVIRLLGGGQPFVHGINAAEFLVHFVPYYVIALSMAALAGAGSYTFAAFALAAANFWIHILATIYTVLRRSGSFVVTPKKGAAARQPRAVMPALVAVGVLVAVSIFGLLRNTDPATINNVSFAAFHVSVLMTGCWAALEKPKAQEADSVEPAGAVA